MSDSLMLKPSELKSEIGDFLIGEIPSLTEELNALKTAMDALDSSAWTDKGGQAFKSKFAAFITDSLKMNEDLLNYGHFVNSYSAEMANIVSKHAANIK